MKITKLDERFFESTRGRIVSLLRGRSGTVNELAEKLELTDREPPKCCFEVGKSE